MKETDLRTDGLSLTLKVLMDARDGFQSRRAQHEAHKKYLEDDLAKTERGIEKCDLAIKELTTAIFNAS